MTSPFSSSATIRMLLLFLPNKTVWVCWTQVWQVGEAEDGHYCQNESNNEPFPVHREAAVDGCFFFSSLWRRTVLASIRTHTDREEEKLQEVALS